jgi:hypothetical protein
VVLRVTVCELGEEVTSLPIKKVRDVGEIVSGSLEVFPSAADGAALVPASVAGFNVAEQYGQLFVLSRQGIGPSTRMSAKAITIPGTVTAVIFDKLR